MDIYKANLTGLLGLCAALYAGQHFFLHGAARPQQPQQQQQQQTQDGDKTKAAEAARAAQKAQEAKETAAAAHAWDFLVVYALVMAADWLQGPYLYSLYADEHRVAPSHVPLLFATGFVAGGVSASVVGGAADRHGRRHACLVFCATYAASCLLTVASAWLPVLLLGRVLGGISTSLLFSVFEGWMVTDFWEREKYGEGSAAGGGSGGAAALEKTPVEAAQDEEAAAARLSHIFGRMGTLNSLAAIASGVSSEWLVEASGTYKAPFVASAALLGLAAWRIVARWVCPTLPFLGLFLDCVFTKSVSCTDAGAARTKTTARPPSKTRKTAADEHLQCSATRG